MKVSDILFYADMAAFGFGFYHMFFSQNYYVAAWCFAFSSGVCSLRLLLEKSE